MGDDCFGQDDPSLAVERELDGAAENRRGEIVALFGKGGEAVQSPAQLLQLVEAIAVDRRQLEGGDGDDAVLELAGQGRAEGRRHGYPAFAVHLVNMPSEEQRHEARA